MQLSGASLVVVAAYATVVSLVAAVLLWFGAPHMYSVEGSLVRAFAAGAVAHFGAIRWSSALKGPTSANCIVLCSASLLTLKEEIHIFLLTELTLFVIGRRVVW